MKIYMRRTLKNCTDCIIVDEDFKQLMEHEVYLRRQNQIEGWLPKDNATHTEQGVNTASPSVRCSDTERNIITPEKNYDQGKEKPNETQNTNKWSKRQKNLQKNSCKNKED